MNIFILDENPEKAAEYHTDSHVVKMILESVQILSTVCNNSGQVTRYKPTHINHPCTKWARESVDNWKYLFDFTQELHGEWQYRFSHLRNHKSYDAMLELNVPDLPKIGITPFAQAMPDEYKNEDPVIAYRNYYNNTKKHLFKWTKRSVPTWITL